MKKFILLLFMLLISNVSFADLTIKLINESSLPYEFSPSNYDNSPNNYNNSINNYDNSPNNYDNSESNYNNSSSNYDNSKNGSQRLILNNYFVGYYVISSNGVVNFFSPRGKRMFFNPKNSTALFDNNKGDFVGVIASKNGNYNVYLTQYGNKLLNLYQ